jgi:hypothetical protein
MKRVAMKTGIRLSLIILPNNMAKYGLPVDANRNED